MVPDVVSSSRRLVNKNGGVLGESYSTVDGTSFSAPIVSGVVALMLES
ncbi:S8 family serine peptidase [Avibacterium paragallinarum]|nr:S8 family serine peptidase [Avibacterium paragallinarum]